ncbi:MAG: hypothetical protein J7L82_02380 [Staphylothermus sp.]|nr:hypothetical protein [Staphylothermus sp.]
MNHKYVFVIVLMALMIVGGTVAYANYVVSPTPTGYYLPKGYKVTAKVYVPDAPLWGNTIGDAVGLSCDKYSVIVFGWGEKTWNWEAKHGIKVIWREGGTDEDKAYVDLEPDKKHDVTIVYDWDGTVKISVDGKFIYSFVATESRYTIVAQGATVNEPEALPEPSTTPPTGSGYNRASVNELQTQYLLLGAGATIIVVAAIMMFAKGNKKQAARTSMALLIIIMLVLGMVATATYFIYRSSQVSTVLPLPLTEEIGNKPVLVALQFGAIQPGTVFEVYGDKQGWQIKQKDTTLYEKLQLTNIDLSLNDVVAWHGYIAYFSPGQCISFDNPQSAVDNSIAWQVRFKLVSTDESGNSPIFDPPESPRLHAEMNTHRVFVFYDNSSLIGLLVSKPAIDMIDGNWHVVTANHHNGLLNTWYDGTQYAIDIADNGEPKLYSPIILGPHYGGFTEMISYAIVWQNGNDVNGNIDPQTTPLQNLEMLIDPTFFNGTHYFDLISNVVGTPRNGVTRIPAEQPFLWFVKNLKSDNLVHFMYFPEGTIIKIKDSSGNVIREFTITGQFAGNTTQVLDYAVSLDTTSLVGATVEALVPSMKIRVYAPSSSYVAILAEDGTKYGEYQVGSSGYVDIPLTNPLTNAYIVVYADNEAEEGLNIDVKDLGDGKIQVKVYNDKGVLIPGMLVRLVDPANVVLCYGITDESGTVVLDAGRPLAEAKILVDGVWDGTIYKLSKTVTLAETMGAEVEPVVNTNEQYRYALLGLFIVILLVLAVVVMKRR